MIIRPAVDQWDRPGDVYRCLTDLLASLDYALTVALTIGCYPPVTVVSG